MKKILIVQLVLTLVLLSSCKSKNNTGDDWNIDNPITAENYDDENRPTDGLPVIEFEEMEYNFGTVIQGEKVAHRFVFRNTGDGNLVISNVRPSCGCTSPKWSKEPVKPGEKGFVELTFDSSSRNGIQNKTAKVYSNTEPNCTDIVIRCEIVTK